MPGIPKLGALAVVVRDNHVLLVRRTKAPDAGLWGFPGGHVELGETALNAAVRELLEETGIVGKSRKYLTNIDFIELDDDGLVIHHFLLAAVLCDYISGKPTAGDDASDARWISIRDVLENRISASKYVDMVVCLANDHHKSA
jgi:8-oxo-dGTP diphosphatase